MDITYLSLIIFVILTIVYFTFSSIGKLPITLSILENNQLEQYYYSNLPRLGLYFLAVVISQFVLNVLYLVNKCGGDAGTNVGAAALFTFIPWVLIFGILIGVIVIFPGLKSAFSDVIGYFAISGKANQILNDLLLDTSVENAIEQMPNISDEKRGQIKASSEALMKLVGNKSILINKMNPENFLSVWNILKPLMKPNLSDIQEKQNELLNLTIIKDNVGEAMWYVYSAILITSIVSYNLVSRGCIKDIASIKESHNEYVNEIEKKQKQEKLNNSTTMVIS
jgi:hypothetical protein